MNIVAVHIMYDDIGHPLDIRDIDTDPALVDLQPFKDAAHADRLQREATATKQRHKHMRQQQDDPNPYKNIGGNKTIAQHAAKARTNLKFAREADKARIEELEYDIADEIDINKKLRMIEDLVETKENYAEVTEILGR